MTNKATEPVEPSSEPVEMYSKVAGVTRWSGGTLVLTRGMSIAEDHPLVAEKPDMFTYERPATAIRTPGPGVRGRVQTGVQRPGEYRSETSGA